MNKARVQKMEQQASERSNNQELTMDELEQVGGGLTYGPYWARVPAGRMSLGGVPTEEEMGSRAGSNLDQ